MVRAEQIIMAGVTELLYHATMDLVPDCLFLAARCQKSNTWAGTVKLTRAPAREKWSQHAIYDC